jgi:hypothetical protein
VKLNLLDIALDCFGKPYILLVAPQPELPSPSSKSLSWRGTAQRLTCLLNSMAPGTFLTSVWSRVYASAFHYLSLNFLLLSEILLLWSSMTAGWTALPKATPVPVSIASPSPAVATSSSTLTASLWLTWCMFAWSTSAPLAI